MILQLQATPEEVMRAVEALQAFAREKGLGEKEAFGLALALEECGSNIVNHGLKRDPRLSFQVGIHHTDDTITLELRDPGPEFDPTRARPAVHGLDDDNRPPGGWGIELVRHYMDEIQYRREASENVLRLTKRLIPA